MVSITDEVPSSGRDALAVPDSHYVVERVPFDRDLAGVTDDAEELLARESRRGFGARHVLDALVFEGAVHVVGAEVKGDRSRVLTEEHPVRLDVWKVVEQQARGLEAGQGLRRLGLPAPPEIVDLGGGEGFDLDRGARGV